MLFGREIAIIRGFGATVGDMMSLLSLFLVTFEVSRNRAFVLVGIFCSRLTATLSIRPIDKIAVFLLVALLHFPALACIRILILLSMIDCYRIQLSN